MYSYIQSYFLNIYIILYMDMFICSVTSYDVTDLQRLSKVRVM